MLLQQQLDQCPGFVLVHGLAAAHVVQGFVSQKAAVDVQCGLAGLRMGAGERMADTEGDLLFDGLCQVSGQVGDEVTIVIDAVNVLDLLPHSLRQAEIGSVAVGE